jgi:hypothetical protein
VLWTHAVDHVGTFAIILFIRAYAPLTILTISWYSALNAVRLLKYNGVACDRQLEHTKKGPLGGRKQRTHFLVSMFCRFLFNALAVLGQNEQCCGNQGPGYYEPDPWTLSSRLPTHSRLSGATTPVLHRFNIGLTVAKH